MTESVALPEPSLQRQRLQAFLAHERPPPAKPPTHVTNDISDIRGARPLLKDHVYVNKPHFYAPNDIEGSGSKELHPRHRRISSDDRLKQLPIEGTSPCPAGFKTNRVCDPLNPSYKLPSFQEAPPVVPRFMRDSYNVSDIAGTSFKKKEIANPRSPLRLDDIPGSQAGWLPFNKRGLRENPPRDILDVSDITNVNFKSSRITNVLDPVYTVNGMTYQDDIHVHPKPLHQQLNKPSYALQTADIAGASGSDPKKTVVCGIVNEQRKDYRVTNRTDDITGARADTVLHSIRSNRRVDPNWPEYKVLDGKKVDSSAMSVARSIVFADLIKDHDIVWKKNEPSGPYVVCGIANIGMTGTTKEKEKPPRRSTAPAVVLTGVVKAANGSSSRTLTAAGSAAATARPTPAQKKEAEARREEIRMVQDLK